MEKKSKLAPKRKYERKHNARAIAQSPAPTKALRRALDAKREIASHVVEGAVQAVELLRAVVSQELTRLANGERATREGVTAAGKLIDLSGYKAPTTAHDKALADCTLAELQQIVQAGELELAKHDSATIEGSTVDEGTDMFE
jgi:hypothetical protein